MSGRRTGEAAYKEYNRTLSRFNRELKLLARSTGVTLPVTSYTIRHSFASFLKEQDVSIEVISELLGHKSIKTTQGSPDKPGGLSIQLCKSEKKEFYIRYSS